MGVSLMMNAVLVLLLAPPPPPHPPTAALRINKVAKIQWAYIRLGYLLLLLLLYFTRHREAVINLEIHPAVGMRMLVFVHHRRRCCCRRSFPLLIWLEGGCRTESPLVRCLPHPITIWRRVCTSIHH